MAINWYPGHMHKASKAMREALSDVDVVVELLDARLPHSSQNPMIAELAGDKPCIKILNKADLADADLTAQWQSHFEEQAGVRTLCFTQDDEDRRERVLRLVDKLAPTPAKSRTQVIAMVLGIPNVGKSSLINAMAGRKLARTGNEAAITRGLQRIKIHDKLLFLDTPGVLWPKIANPNSGYRLAASGAIRDTAIELDDVASFLCGFLLACYPEQTLDRFGPEPLPATEFELLERIGRQRGCLRAGGHVDIAKASSLIIAEFRAGTLGRMTLETPAMIERESAEVEAAAAEKAAKKAARKKR